MNSVPRHCVRVFPIFLCAFLLCVFCSGCTPQTRQASTRPSISPRQWKQVKVPDDEVNLILFGDWGASGSNQRAVAEAMAQYVERQPAAFNGVVTAGDNFYSKEITSPEHPLFQTLFENMYDPARLNIPFYIALGNHDYDPGKAEAELAYARLNPWSRWTLPAPFYRVDFPVGSSDPLLTVFVLNSNRPKLSRQEWDRQKRWLESELRNRRTAPWTICIAHHPLFSNGIYGDNGVMQREWGPIFKRNQVDFYVCGHEHDLQHLQIQDWYTQFMLVGGGGAGKRFMRRDNRGPFSRSLYGFAHVRITANKFAVKFVTTDQSVVHQFERTASGNVKVLRTTGTDKPTTQPLKSLQGLDALPATRPTTKPTTLLATPPAIGAPAPDAGLPK